MKNEAKEIPQDNREIPQEDFEKIQFRDDLPVYELYGSPENIAKHGSPSESNADIHLRYYFYPTWRSQMSRLIAYAILCVLAVEGSLFFPKTVIVGKLFAIGSTTYLLHLPLLVLLPGMMVGKILILIYNSIFIIDERGVEAQIGLVSLFLRQPRLRYEDIRGVEPNQTIWERILGIGSLVVGSSTRETEIIMYGLPNPRAIQILINSERDKALSKLAQLPRMLTTSNT